MMNQHFEDVVLNHTLYFNVLDIFEQRNKFLLTKYPSHFVEDCLRHSEMTHTNYNIVRKF
jgi:hypothetical protein